MYSAGMVQSASSSNTQWPSDCWKPRTPSVADAMLDSKFPDSKFLDSKFLDSWASRLVAFTESISLDCSDSRLKLTEIDRDKCPSGPPVSIPWRPEPDRRRDHRIGPIPRWLQAIP